MQQIGHMSMPVLRRYIPVTLLKTGSEARI